MATITIAGQKAAIWQYNTVIVGAGAAGMNCAVHLYEFMTQKGIKDAGSRIAVVTAGVELGASRMSGSDKQTYYKVGTSADVPDCAEGVAKSLTAGGCCHGDLALAEAVGSLREFYHLVEVGVPFPHNALGGYIGYKTDNDPAERATSAGPKTSRFMSERLQEQVERYGIKIHDNQEVVELLAADESKRIAGVVTIDRKRVSKARLGVSVFYCENLVLAAGGPGMLYQASVYPEGQMGIHGPAFKAGLVAENLTESQFGLASTKFRWNVSGTYMQAVPRIFSTASDGGDERDFLADAFPTMSKMATAIFLKGYQWPFAPERIENFQSSLIDVLVSAETGKGRRVFLDFRKNPIGKGSMKKFDLSELEPEAREYLEKAGALQARPIERLAHMNPLAIDVYKENGIDLRRDPLEIAVCAQHNNGGFAVDRWWQSNVPHTFVIGEMAGTHGVKRPGGAALNAGQVGGLRAAEFIVNVHGCGSSRRIGGVEKKLKAAIAKLAGFLKSSGGLAPGDIIADIQARMTASGGHVRRLPDARKALADAVALYKNVRDRGFQVKKPNDLVAAVQAEHLALASVAYLKAIVALLEEGGGSRGSYLVVAHGGTQVHPDVIDAQTGGPLKFKPENKALRDSILQVCYDPNAEDLFNCSAVPVRPMPAGREAFEVGWRKFREGEIFQD